MTKRDIVVIGASAGGVETLLKVIGTLPADFAGAIFIVLHLSPLFESNLPAIIERAGSLKASHPKDGEEIKPAHIYIAEPDHHLLIEKENRIGVNKGSGEERFRPSIDGLFRSAAQAYGNRVIGVVLSGLLDDGTFGMAQVQRCGGITIVQDPADALYPSMPNHVLQNMEVDYVLPASKIGYILTTLIASTLSSQHSSTEPTARGSRSDKKRE